MTKISIIKSVSIIAAIFAAIETHAVANGFFPGFQNGDLLLSFRQFPTGGPAGTFDVTFDLGNVNTFLSSYNGSRIQLNSTAFTSGPLGRTAGFDASLLTGAGGANYGSLNNLRFGVTASDPSADVDDMWATRLRGSSTDYSVKNSTAWDRKSSFSQATAANSISSVGVNGQSFGTSLSTDAVKTTDSSAQGYNTISSGGKFNNYFAAGTEGFTGASFTSSDAVRLDFYSVIHNDAGTISQGAVYQGVFELQGNGDLFYTGKNFTVVPEPSTYGLFAGVGLLAVGLRRKFVAA